MKKLMLGAAVFVSTFAANAESYVYYADPTYCKVSWNCDVVAEGSYTATKFCERHGFYSGTAAVYEYANGQRAVLKGYGCFESPR